MSEVILDTLTDGFDFGVSHSISADGQIAGYAANYIDFVASKPVVINSINDATVSDIAKKSLLNVKYAMHQLIDSDESKQRESEPAGISVFGLLSSGQTTKVYDLKTFAYNFTLYGRPTIYIGDTYLNGQRIEANPGITYDTSDITTATDNGDNQVIRLTYYNNEGYRSFEYGGTPREIAYWLLGGRDFFNAHLDEGSITSPKHPLDEVGAELDKLVVDGRVVPGITWNAYWEENYANVVRLLDCELEFIDSNNSALYGVIKAAQATLSVCQNRVIRHLNKHFIKLADGVDASFWFKILNTKLYHYDCLISKTSEIIDVEWERNNKLKSVTVNDASYWPDFGFIAISGEILQYRKRVGNVLLDLDRQVRGKRCFELSSGVLVDVVGSPAGTGLKAKITGNVRYQETERAFKNRAVAFLGHKETQAHIQKALESIISHYEGASISVFDLNSADYIDPEQDLEKWAQVKRDIGWMAGKDGFSVTSSVLADYDKATKTLTVTATDPYELYDLCTGGLIEVTQDHITKYQAQIWSIDVELSTIVLINTLQDADGVECDDFAGWELTGYALGTETNKIRTADTTDKLNFSPQTLLGKKLETTGYYRNTLKLTNLLYETDNNAEGTTVSQAKELEDTSEYHPHVVDGIRMGNSYYPYTGRVLSYEVEPDEVRPLEGRYPFIVLVENWRFNDNIIRDTINRVKAIGTTPNIAINKQYDEFRVSLSNQHAPFVDFTVCHRIDG